MLPLVLWRHVVFLCVSLVMVVRRMLCSVRLAAQHTTHNHNQTHLNTVRLTHNTDMLPQHQVNITK